MQPVKSSAIAAIGYEPTNKSIHVQFNSGGTHQFGPFEQKHYKAMLNAPSIGKHYHQYIKHKEISQ